MEGATLTVAVAFLSPSHLLASKKFTSTEATPSVTAEGFNTTLMERQPCRRRRPALSCVECRRRKIKCDRNDPCAHCVTAKTRCTFKIYSNESVLRQQPQQGSASGSTSSPWANAHSPLTQTRQTSANGLSVECDTHASRPGIVAAAGQNDTPDTSTFGRNKLPPPNRTQYVEADFRDLLQRVRKLEGSAASSPMYGSSETGRDLLVRQSNLQDAQISVSKTRVLRWSHWMGAAPEVQST